MCNNLVHDSADKVHFERRGVCSGEKVSKREVKSKGSIPEIVKISEVWVFLANDVDTVKSREVELGTGASHFGR